LDILVIVYIKSRCFFAGSFADKKIMILAVRIKRNITSHRCVGQCIQIAAVFAVPARTIALRFPLLGNAVAPL
jgi:hypothetical protein